MATKTKAPTMRKPASATRVFTAVLPELKNSPSEDAEKRPAIEERTDVPVGFELAAATLAAQEFEVGKIYKVPLFKLQKSENNARFFYSAEEIDDMSVSLQEKGQDVPALGYVKSGHIVITDGEKRLRAAANAGLPTLDVKIITQPSTAAEEYEVSRRVNIERSTQTALDDAVRWNEMLAKGQYESQDDLADRLKLEKGYVSKILGINRIPERLRRMMSDHPSTRAMTVAYAISMIFADKRLNEIGLEKAEEIASEVIDETVKNELGRSQVEALIAKKLTGPQTRAQPESISVRYGDAKGLIKVFPTRGQLDLSFKDLPPGKAKELADIIQRALSPQLSLS